MSLSSVSSLFRSAVKMTVPLLFIAAGAWAGIHFINAPKAVKKRPAQPRTDQVAVVRARQVNAPAMVRAMGLVVPALEISLKSRVNGEIIQVSKQFLPGGLVKADEVLARIDPADYQITLAKAQSAVEKARADLDLEQGNQTIAREELRLLSQARDSQYQATDLVLRKPQLAQAKADLHLVEADLKQAKLNLSRTRIIAPFNAMIKERQVNLGTHVSTQDTLALLVGTDAYWIRAAVAPDRLRVLDVGRKGGIPAQIKAQTGTFQGQVIQITGTLTDNTRLAQVLVRVDDPLGLETGGPALLLDDYVSLEIQGRALADVIEVPRATVRDNDTVWIYDRGQLDIRQLEPVWKTEDAVYVTHGIAPGDAIVATRLSTPVQGMALALEGAGAGSGPEKKQNRQGLAMARDKKKLTSNTAQEKKDEQI